VNLTWREATREDRVILRAFECTRPAPKEPGRRAKKHPKPWEKSVQTTIRTLPPPTDRRDGTCLLGFDGDRLVAYSLWVETAGRPGVFKLRLLAISTAVRGGDGAVARVCLDETLARIESSLEPGVDGLVFGLVHVSNSNSQRLLNFFNFAVVPDAPVGDPELQMWATRVRGR
jgi:hypothetical protein